MATKESAFEVELERMLIGYGVSQQEFSHVMPALLSAIWNSDEAFCDKLVSHMELASATLTSRPFTNTKSENPVEGYRARSFGIKWL